MVACGVHVPVHLDLLLKVSAFTQALTVPQERVSSGLCQPPKGDTGFGTGTLTLIQPWGYKRQGRRDLYMWPWSGKWQMFS